MNRSSAFASRPTSTLMLRTVRVAALCLPLCACSSLKSAQQWVFGGSDESRPAAAAAPVKSSADGMRQVYSGKYSWIKVGPAESGGHSALPVKLDSERLKTALGELKGTGGGFRNEPLFSASELGELCPQLTQALEHAQPGEDVTFAITGKHTEMGLFETESVTTARVFVEGGRLQLIFGMTRINFGDELRGEGMLRPFIPGQRAVARDQSTPVVGVDWQAAAGRPDWVSIDAGLLAPTSALVQPVSPLQAPASPLQPAVSPLAAPAPAAAAVAPAPAPAPAAIPARAPAAGDTDSGTVAERRLTTLQRLRDKGLISEQEFQERRKGVLDGL